MKNKFGLFDKDVETIVSVLSQQPKVEKAYIFGSRAKGNFKNGSDIDLALKGDDLDFDTISQISYKLNEETLMPYKFDVLNYHTIKEPDLKDHIDRVGIELYSRWKGCKILELGKVVTGNTPSSKFPEEFGNEMPFVTPTDYKNYNKWIFNADRNLSDKGINKLKNRVLPANSLLVTCIGSDMGKIAINKIPVVTNQQINSIITNEKVNPDFLYYKLVSCYDVLRTYGEAGTAVPIVNKSDFENIEITIPSDLKEQTAIASILSSLDDKIDLLHQQNKTLEQLAETLFIQWFVEEAEESWEEKTLTDIADYLNGLALQKFPAKIDYLPVIKIREMKQGISENTDRCSRDIPAQYIIQDGDVLFSWSGSLEVVLWTDGEGALNQHLFKVSSKVYPKWFYYLATKHHLAEFKVIADSKSTTMGHIQREHLKQAMISIPPKELFNQYNERIAPMIDKLIDNNKQIRTLTQTRDTLLPKLMSGEVRVSL